MYKVNDYVVYGNMGVCRITDITTPSFQKAPADGLYYVLAPVRQNCTIYTPIDSHVYMRPIVSRDEAEQMIRGLAGIRVETDRGGSKQALEEYYNATVKTHDCADLLRFVMSISETKIKMNEPNCKLGQLCDSLVKQAEELLYGEFSLALGVPIDKVQPYIASHIRALEAAEA